MGLTRLISTTYLRPHLLRIRFPLSRTLSEHRKPIDAPRPALSVLARQRLAGVGLTRLFGTTQLRPHLPGSRPPAPLRPLRLSVLIIRLSNTTPLASASFIHRRQPTHITRKPPSSNHIPTPHRLSRHLTRLTALKLTPPKTPRLPQARRITPPHLTYRLRPPQQSPRRLGLQRIGRHKTTQPRGRNRRRLPTRRRLLRTGR